MILISAVASHSGQIELISVALFSFEKIRVIFLVAFLLVRVLLSYFCHGVVTDKPLIISAIVFSVTKFRYFGTWRSY